MIEQVDGRLKDWVQSILNGTTLSLAPPGQVQKGSGVSLYLLELVDKPPLRGGPDKPPLQLSLRYLVTTWAATPEEAHQALGQLVFATMDHGEFEVELEPISANTWAAFGIIPQPAFVLCVPLRLERPKPVIPPVRTPPVVQGAPVTTMFGLLLGPGDIPVARARVEFPSLQRSTNTDDKGRFHFVGVPSEPVSKQLCIKAKGKIIDVVVEEATTKEEPAVIQVDLLAKEE